ncbi:MAG TPA: glycosyltransferase family 39 protein, partial [Chloroflexota bacterium]|nr:glycosyltransferase family 39 protein [Chloroflexota bacterium]
MATLAATRKSQAWHVFLGVAGIFLGILAQSFVGGREYVLDGLLLYAAALAMVLRSLLMPTAATSMDPSAPGHVAQRRSLRFTAPAAIMGCAAIAANGLSLFLFGTSSAVNLAAVLYLASVLAAPAALWVAAGAPRPRLFAGWSVGELLALFGALVIGAALRFPGLDVLPFGLWWDEGFTGGQVTRIASDPNYRPVFLAFPGQGATLSYYLCIPFVALFGPGPVGLRAMAAVGGVFGILTTALLGRELFGRRAGLIAGLLVAVMAWQVNFSRIAFNAIWSVSLDALTVYLFLRAIRSRRPLLFGLAGTSLGIGANMYHTTELILVVLSIYLAHAAATRGLAFTRERLAGLALFALVALLTASPLIEFAVQHPSEFTARANQVSVLREVAERGSYDPLISNVKRHLAMFNYEGDRNGRHNIPGLPMLDMATGALFILGLGMAAMRPRRPEAFMMLCWLPVMMAPGILSLSFEAPQSLRAIEAITPVALLASLPVASLGAVLSRVRGPGLSLGYGGQWGGDARLAIPFGALLLAAFLGWIGYLNYDRYFVRQASDPAVWREFSTAETEIARQINRLGRDYDFVLGETLVNHPTIEYLTGRKGIPRFDGASGLPLRSDKSVALFLEPHATQALAMLRSLYPGGETQPLRPPGGGSPIMSSFVVSRTEVLALRGADVTCYPNQSWNGEAAVAGRVPTLDLPWASSQLPPLPFSAIWRASLLAPSFGRYIFVLEPGGAADLLIDGSKVAAGGQRQEVILPKGLHTLEMRAVLTEKKVPRLMWQPPESAQLAAVPSDVLFGSPASSNGLQGSYYRNASWAGQPELQQIDPFLDIGFHILPLPRPYSVEWTGKLLAPRGGQYRFAVESADA